MLTPDLRVTLLDALRPPPGFHLGCAVGTTFSLSLDAALTAPAAFALHSVVDATEHRDIEPIELLDSMRRHAGLFTVFFQAGQIAVPAQRRLFAYLEGALVPVTAPGGGVFHPKVWVLRFELEGGPPTFRMLCLSRNLTHDRAWDTVLRLDALDHGNDGQFQIEGSGLATFIRALPEITVSPMEPTRRQTVLELADELAHVRWASPPHVRGGRFHPLGLSGSSTPPFPSRADGMAVISPFLTTGLLSRLPSSTGRRVLVSRPDQILATAPTVMDTFNEVYTLDPDAAVAGDPNVLADDEARRHPSVEDPSVPLEGLHAKVFVFDHANSATVLTGSANATTAAFGSNVEFVTELEGTRSHLGVQALLADPAPEVQTLRTFLMPFPLEELPHSEIQRDDVEDELDRLRRSIASVALTAQALDEGSGERFRLHFASTQPMDTLSSDVTWRCWPITIPDTGGVQVLGGELFEAEFTVSFEGITAFLGNELALGDACTRFVLTADLTEAPANRATRLLRLLLGDAERFLRYLLLLLTDEAADQYGLTDLLDVLDSPEPVNWQMAAQSLPLLEALLRTLVNDPSRLDHIERLITDLDTDPEGESLFPDGLRDIWEPIWAAANERRQA